MKTPRRVLLVDDQPPFLEALSAMLLAAPELEVVGRAGDGVQALDAARSLGPDLIFMDVDMPRMDGIEATRQIVAELPEVGVIMVTGSALTENEERARSAGATGYVTKDCIACDLLPAVRASFPRFGFFEEAGEPPRRSRNGAVETRFLRPRLPRGGSFPPEPPLPLHAATLAR